MNHPLISILMPTYNRAVYLSDAIASVRAQSFPDWELIVIDDESTDETPMVLRRLAAGDPRIRVLRRTHVPHGPGPARNVGLRIARGDWTIMLDDDDCWMPDTLERMAAAIVDDVVLIGSDCRMQGLHQRSDTALDFLRDTMVPWWTRHALAREVIDWTSITRQPEATLIRPDINIAMALGGFMWVLTCSTLLRRNAVVSCGGFDEQLRRTQDWVLWLQLLHRGPWIYLPDVLAVYFTEGRDDGSGARYAKQSLTRKHDRYVEQYYHLKFLENLPYRARLWPEAYAFQKNRIGVHHQRCREAARGTRPLKYIWHTLAGWGYPPY